MKHSPVTQHFSFYCSTPDFISGLSSYTDSFISAYAESFPTYNVIIHTNARLELLQQCQKKSNIQFKKLHAPALLPFKFAAIWSQTRLAFKLRRNGRPLVSTTSIASIIPFCRIFITMHDLYDVDFKYRRWHNVIYFRILYLWLSVIISRCIAVSNTTANLAKPYFGNIGKKIFVAREASKFEVSTEKDIVTRRKRGTFLFVANINNTKNVECLVKALNLADKDDDITVSVLWVGHDRRGFASEAIAQNDGCPSLHSLGSVSDHELVDLYRSCDALVVTSWTEGFCLPVLEAQSFGCPIIASDIPIMKEVAGDESIFFSPTSPEELVACFKKYLSEDTDEVAMRQMALHNARKFSWHESVKKLEAELI